MVDGFFFGPFLGFIFEFRQRVAESVSEVGLGLFMARFSGGAGCLFDKTAAIFNG
jgi:hypothetical protein